MTTIPSEVFKKELFDLLDETFEHTQGIYLDRGTALFDTLSHLSAEQASTPIGSNGATIAGHVNHLCVYLSVLTDCIRREPAIPINWDEGWALREVSSDEWEATQQRLRVSYQATLDVMKAVQTWEGEDDIGASLAILAHTALHLGVIRQAMHALKTAG
ncbi:hypothetical protein KKG90_08105 [Candidatus Bipolaricaulota bacterium]|nr:hypothetical protein [Candidatus Bipolaricaulota bacterium]